MNTPFEKSASRSGVRRRLVAAATGLIPGLFLLSGTAFAEDPAVTAPDVPPPAEATSAPASPVPAATDRALKPDLIRKTATGEDPGARYLFGDWGGERSRLEELGVVFTLGLTYDTYGNVSGGYRDAWNNFERLRMQVDLDMQKLVGWEGGEIFVTSVSQYGNRYAKGRIGVYTNPSSIEGADTTRLGEIWVGQKLWEDKIKIRVGKLDGVGEFGVQEYGSTFMNDELAYVPNIMFGLGMPFDPAGKPGAVITVRPFEGKASGLYVKAGIFAGNDGNPYAHDPDGLNFNVYGPTLVGAEIGFRTTDAAGSLPSSYKLGMHYSDGDYANLANGAIRYEGNSLIYFNAAQTVMFLDKERTRHLDVAFSVAGMPGNRNFNELEYTGMFRVVGPIDGRPKDEFGVGFILSNFSSEASQANVAAGGPPLDSEKTLEVTYKYMVRPWFSLQPDFQIVFDPQGIESRSAVYIIGLRTQIAF